MKLTLQSKLSLYPLQIRQDKKHYIVEDNQSGEFFEMPKVCIDALEMIKDGKTIGEIEQSLRKVYPTEEVELIPFAEQLIDLGLVKEIDGQKVGKEKKNQSPTGLQWIPVRLGQFFFNKIASKLYLVFFLTNIFLLFSNPTLLPSYRDIFVFDSMMLNIVTYMTVSLVLIMIHEFGHILAIRAHGLPAKLDIGHRLFFVVFETDLTPAWKLSPKQRNRLYFAGMSFEQIILFFAFMITLVLTDSHLLIQGIIGIIIFDLFIKFIYQCCFYMKTDLYYVVENVTGCYNLMESGKQMLRKWLPVRKSAPSTTEVLLDNETKIVRYYSVFYLCGIILMSGLFIFYFLPQALYAISRSLNHLVTYPTSNPYFWDGIAFLTQMIVMLGLLGFAWVKNRANR
ncbi:peptidase [Ornithinibacillus sp. L9]|uniref:Peptidase n=1 Tax=Ornithinibacillus caprae TaxID=2678566 RepID=A0A6N8FE75_9BACI|nr:peptidase [Ornithinibacillus caprae]MUK87501.1 peptidase [Ornithinibacillus caprae]